MRILFLSIFLLGQFVALGQNTQIYTHDSYYFRTALELYNKEKYNAAQEYFEKYIGLNKNDQLSIEAEYYAGDCALQLFHEDGESRLKDFIKKYPQHPKVQQALLAFGNIYKGKKEFKKALSYYQNIDIQLLSKEQASEMQFNTGYCLLNDKQLEKALPYFNSLKNSPNKYTYASAYYAGNIEFKQGNYDAALVDYQKAEQNESYKTLVPYMITNVYYKQKKFDQLIAYTDTLTKKSVDFKNHEEINLILADVYFRKQEYLKSITATENYKNLGKELPADAQYRYAKSFYYAGRNEKAVENFKKIATNKDSIGQYSSYFLALCYLRDDNKPFALPLLSQASSMTYSKQIQEEALFLYGKVNYETGKFTEVISSLKDYRKKFPRGQFGQEASEILGDALLNTNNYSEALEYIESLPKRSERIDRVYQKVAYHRGEELYNQDLPDSAVAYFEKSQEYPYDKMLVASANYWVGEALSMKRDYKTALDYYFDSQENKAYAKEEFYQKANYGIGYCFFNQKMYDKAGIRFKQFVENKESKSSSFYSDALLRLGDCNYAQKKYGDALQNYELALQSHNKETDYILLQKGLLNGMQGNYEQADNLLYALIHNYPKSPYYETALFNKAMFGVERGDYQTAVQGFTMFIRERPGSTYVPYALERRAICNVNLKNTELAYHDYQTVLKEYPTSPVANAALQGIQEIMSKEGKNEEFLAVLEEFKNANPQKSDLENIEFESAKRLYFDQKYNEAIKVLNNFLSRYPTSALGYDATYYLADSYYRLGKFAESLGPYQKVVEASKGTYTNRSLYKIAEIHFNSGKYQEAMEYYRQLQQLAGSKKDVANAYQGIMHSFYQTANYDSSLAYAKAIVNSGYASTTGQNKALLFQAKSVLAKGDTVGAVDYFLTTVNEAQDEHGAEAQYTIALLFYNQKKYKSSLNELFSLNQYFSEYTKWVGKSFLLIAQNYQELKEHFQAKATLESLVKNFPDEEIVAEAKQRLTTLKPESNQ